MDDIYEIEGILDIRYTNKEYFFKIKWVNYNRNESTWEPEDNLIDYETAMDLINNYITLLEKKKNVNSKKIELAKNAREHFYKKHFGDSDSIIKPDEKQSKETQTSDIIDFDLKELEGYVLVNYDIINEKKNSVDIIFNLINEENRNQKKVHYKNKSAMFIPGACEELLKIISRYSSENKVLDSKITQAFSDFKTSFYKSLKL